MDIQIRTGDIQFPLEDVIRLIRDGSLVATDDKGELSIKFRKDGANKLFYTLTAQVAHSDEAIAMLLKKQ